MLKLKTYGLRILNPGERPPYPIIIERPTVKDVYYIIIKGFIKLEFC